MRAKLPRIYRYIKFIGASHRAGGMRFFFIFLLHTVLSEAFFYISDLDGEEQG